jgi:hypothetical protein
VAAWLAERKGLARRAPEELAPAATLAAALEGWRDHHFTREGFPDPATRTENWLNTTLAPEGDRALVRHDVRYRHWGYGLDLVVVRGDDGWRVRLVIEAMREHYDVP